MNKWKSRDPVLCFVTDRRRFGASWEEALVRRVRAAAVEGVHLVQIREPDLDGGPLTRLVTACVDAVRGTRARVLVNDRFDVAVATGAHGVHLRGDSFPASRIRACAPPGFLIGRSVHSVSDAVAAAEGDAVNYLIFGTVFESRSKPDRPAAGLRELSAVACATRLPVLAIGGMTSGGIADVMRAGAAGVAGISMFDMPSPVS
jgi:thiamine-phosphate pyrophosphorylase